ncbi:hypothetical protein BH11ACT2_BH11ACT2_05250 [soil metagenome]
MRLFDILITSGFIGFVVWILALALQVVDLANSLANLAAAKDVPLNERRERRAFNSVWSIAGGVALLLLVIAGIDIAVRAGIDGASPLLALFVFAAVLLLAALGGLAIIAGAVRGEGRSYTVLRANLAEDATARLKTSELAVYRTQLAQIDSRRRHIRFGLRDRAGLRAVRVRLEGIADEFATVPPTGFGAIAPVRWRTANVYLWRGNAVRLVPPALTALVTIDGIILCASAPTGADYLAVPVIAGLGTVVGAFLALFASRVTLASKIAWHAVYVKQRLDALRLLEELERSSRKGVAGLGDRVTRALQILRDQQG